MAIDLGSAAGMIMVIVLAAMMGEAVNEYVFAPWFDILKEKQKLSAPVAEQLLRCWSALVGVGIAIEYGLDIFALVHIQAIHPLFGQILTGIVIGRGSNYVHEFVNRLVLSNETLAEKLRVLRQ